MLTWAAASSQRKDKKFINALCPDKALKVILEATAYNFKYKKGKGTGTNDLYAGVMADEIPEVMHHNGTIFSPISGFGYILAGMQALNEKVKKLERICAQ